MHLKTTRLVIADSNGQHLVPSLLHDDKNVKVVTRYTLEEVVQDIPKCKGNVSDIVMLVGINNIKHPNESIPVNVAKFDDTCGTLHSHYPDAVIHVGSVAPSCEKHVIFNEELEKLAKARNAPFISALPILERTPHGLRPKSGTLTNNGNGIHYTKNGVKLFANEIKKSLYRRDIRPILNHQQMR